MLFQTYGDRNHPAVLFFHAMGVTGESSEPVAKYLQDRYFCILPTSTVYCKGQKYVSKADEVRQVEEYLKSQGVERLELVVASSIGADLAMAFLTGTKLPIGHVFFDGGQFAQIGKGTRRIMTPFLYLVIKSLYWSKGGTLKKILWCDDDSIKPYFIAAGENLTYINLRRQLLPAGEREQNIPCDLKDPAWFDKIDASGGAVFFASGVFYYFLTQQVRALVQGMADAFPGGVLVFDAANRTAVKMIAKTWLRTAKIKDVGAYFAVSDAKSELSPWDSRLQVSSRGYMLGYNDLKDPSVSSFFRFLARVGDNGMKMQIVKIGFGDRQ